MTKHNVNSSRYCPQTFIDRHGPNGLLLGEWRKPAHTRAISWDESHLWKLSELFSQVCGVVFCDFGHSCHRRRIFNMLNNFLHEWTFPHSVRAFWAISSALDMNAHALFHSYTNTTTRWRMLTKAKIQARQKMKRFCSWFYYCGEEKDIRGRLIVRRG